LTACRRPKRNNRTDRTERTWSDQGRLPYKLPRALIKLFVVIYGNINTYNVNHLYAIPAVATWRIRVPPLPVGTGRPPTTSQQNKYWFWPWNYGKWKWNVKGHCAQLLTSRVRHIMLNVDLDKLD
jgi:hypothetical protein